MDGLYDPMLMDPAYLQYLIGQMGPGASVIPYGDEGYVSTDEKRNQSFYGTYLTQMSDIMNAALALDQGSIPLEAFAPIIEEEEVELPGAAMRARYMTYDPASPEYLIAELHDQRLSPREIINSLMAIVTPVEGETPEQAAQRENFASMFSRENEFGETYFDRDALESMVLEYDKAVTSDPQVDDVRLNDYGIPTGIRRTETPSEMGEWWEGRGLTNPLVDYTIEDFQDPTLTAAYDQYLQGQGQRAEAMTEATGGASIPELEALLRRQLTRPVTTLPSEWGSSATPVADGDSNAFVDDVLARVREGAGSRPGSAGGGGVIPQVSMTDPAGAAKLFDGFNLDRDFNPIGWARSLWNNDAGPSLGDMGGAAVDAASAVPGAIDRNVRPLHALRSAADWLDTDVSNDKGGGTINTGRINQARQDAFGMGPQFTPEAQKTAATLTKARGVSEANRAAQRRAYSDYFKKFQQTAGTPQEYDRLRAIDAQIRGVGPKPWQNELAARQAQMARAGVPWGY